MNEGRFSRLELTPSKEVQEITDESIRAGKLEAGTPIRTADHFIASAHAARCNGDFERALEAYTRALREDRARIAAWVGQVHVLVELDENAEARLWSDKALELFKNNGELLAGKSRACHRIGDAQGAAACSDASIQAIGSSSMRWISRGEIMLATADKRARDCFERALIEPGSDWFDRVQIARVCLYAHKPGPALEFAMLAQGLAPTHPFAWITLARAHSATGNGPKAEECCRRALELNPQHEAAKRFHCELTNARRASRILRRLKGWITR